RDNVQEQALKIIRNRIDQFGVAEPTVQAQGTDEIVVQLPGVQDPQRAKELIGRTALLEVKLVARGPEAGTIDHPGPNVQVVPGKSEKGRRTSYLLERRTLMTGDVLTDASVGQGAATEGMVVNFVLDARGTKEFGEITSANVGRQLAIVLDGVVESAPVIEDPITGGRGLIREELRLGKTPRAAIEAGYERAWYAIRDSNVTTFCSGLILFQFGSGPVRGFAVTLCLGILTSLATGVFGTRVVYDFLTSRRRLATVSV